MKRWAMVMRILGVVLAAGLMFGCEKNQPPEEATPYNPNVDAPPTNLQINPNPDLLADQATLASAKVAVSTAPASGAADDPAARAVRAEMGKMIDAAKAAQWPTIADYVLEKDANTVKDAAEALGALATAEDALTKAVKINWDKDSPASKKIKQMLERGPNGGPFLARLGEMSANALAIAPLDANTVEVKDRTGAKLTFKKSDDKWLISLTDTQVQVYVALAELAKLQTQAASVLTDGISTSAVTEQNAEGAITEKVKTLADAMKRLTEAMEADQPKTGAAESGSGHAPGGSSGATTAPAGGTEGGGATTAPAGGAAGESSSATTAPAGGTTNEFSSATTAPASGTTGGND